MAASPVTVVETEQYRRSIRGLLTEEENAEFISYISRHPDSGTIISGTGGVRKVRWSAKGKGKSGGVRIIYYHYSSDIPLYLILAYGKSDQDNLTAGEKRKMKSLAAGLKTGHRKQRER